MNGSIEWQKAQNGELYHAFVPELVSARARAKLACDKFNASEEGTRRRAVQLWRDISKDERSLPPKASSSEEDDKLFEKDPWVCGPIRADYGFNIRLGEGVFLNFNSTWVDTCPIKVGARTLIGPNCSFYSGTHPLNPAIRNGTAGPELGKAIDIGEDCWLGGNVIILPGVTIGKGCTVGAGSVVTKDIPAFHIAAGNPAKVLRKIDMELDSQNAPATTRNQEADQEGAEVPMANSTF